MDVREKLVELIGAADEECKHSTSCESCRRYGKGSLCRNYQIADHLIANGAMLLPCKIGDTVYDRYGNPIEIQGVGLKCFFQGVHRIEDSSIGYPFFEKRTLSLPVTFDASDIGKAVFLAREEAEQKLKERENGEC